jgi:iron complex outermembrane receptor protein
VEYGVGLFQDYLVSDSAKISFEYKNDYHCEQGTSNDTARAATKNVFVDKPDIHFRDYTIGVGLEDEVRLGSHWGVVGGLGWNYRKTLTAENLIDTTRRNFYSVDEFDKPEMSAVDGQVALHFRPADGHALSLSIARRTRFPSIKDRFSYRLGTAIPNPDLKPEYTVHYELGYEASPLPGLAAKLSFFESQLYDVIQTVTNVGPNGESQQQNAGRARYAGYETSPTATWAYPAPEVSMSYTVPFKGHNAPGVTIWANGSYIVRRNLTTPSLQFVDVPREEVHGGFDLSPVPFVTMSLDMQYESARASSSDGKWQTDPFTLFNVRLKVPVERCTFYAGVTNVTDVNYALSEGYPEEGRGYYARLALDFHHSPR